MKVTGQITEKELNRKHQIRSPLNIGQTFIGIFTTREITKSGLKRFYLYTQDQQTLVIASELYHINDLSIHRISLSSTNFIPNDQYCLGVLVNKKYSPSVIGKLNHLADQSKREDCISIRMIREYEKTKTEINSDEKNIKITILPHAETEEDDDFTIRQKSFSLFPKLYPEIHFIESDKNVLFLVKNCHCFSLAQLYEEEFFFAVSYPLSIFQGFCIAAAIIN